MWRVSRFYDNGTPTFENAFRGVPVWALSSVSWNGTEPNFAVYLSQNHLLTIFFYAETDGWEINFHKDATARDIEKLISFCSDSLSHYPVRNIGTK